MHHAIPRDQYQLRNSPQVRFQLELKTLARDSDWITRARIRSQDRQWRYEVVFGGEFVATKKNFTADHFEATAVSLIRSQLESLRFVDTRISLRAASGLPRTETEVQLNWEE